MPTPAERLIHVTLKIKRAKEHFRDLKGQTRAFLDSNPYRVACNVDPQSLKPVYYLASVKQTPDCLPLIAGDVIQNLMSALDHLAYQIVCSDTGDKPPNPNWIYFPIADDAEKYEAKKAGKIQGARKETFDAIDALKPYKGGNDLLWTLYRLNNIEKHRLLLTIGSLAAGIHLGQVSADVLRGKMPPEAIAAISSLKLFLNPANKGFPLKAGLRLYIGAPGVKCNPNQQFRFQVGLNEPGIIEGKPLIETSHKLVGLVDDIVTTLSPLLA